MTSAEGMTNDRKMTQPTIRQQLITLAREWVGPDGYFDVMVCDPTDPEAMADVRRRLDGGELAPGVVASLVVSSTDPLDEHAVRSAEQRFAQLCGLDE